MTAVLLTFLPASGIVEAQSIHTTGDTIFVQGSKYLVQIDRVSGIVVMQNSDHVYYTRFPLFAEPLPAPSVNSSPGSSLFHVGSPNSSLPPMR